MLPLVALGEGKFFYTISFFPLSWYTKKKAWKEEDSLTREEIYASIYTHEEIYRPPQEEGCSCLEVALGCSWSQCRFCDFAKDKFQIHPRAKIEWNLRMLGRLEPNTTRLFLLGENAFVMSFEQLADIISMTHEFMPNIKEFSMYARVDDVLRKTPEQLRQLREMGVTDLHIGMESGSDPILLWMNKGVSTFDMLKAFKMLDDAGIGYYVTIILGLGGKAYRNLNAIETARLLNRIHPKCIWALKLKIWDNTPLSKMVKTGEFVPLDRKEILFEERLLLQNLHVEDCFYMDTTVLDRLTIQGWLPEGKEHMLQVIERLLGLYFNPDGSRKEDYDAEKQTFSFLSPLGPKANA